VAECVLRDTGKPGYSWAQLSLLLKIKYLAKEEKQDNHQFTVHILEIEVVLNRILL